MKLTKSILLFALIVTGQQVFCQTRIAAADASKHIGDSVSIEDKIYSAKVFDNGMTLLNVGGKFPNHLLVLMIQPKVKALFTFKPEEQLNRWVRMVGKITDYKGKPQIVISDPKQFEFMKDHYPMPGEKTE